MVIISQCIFPTWKTMLQFLTILTFRLMKIHLNIGTYKSLMYGHQQTLGVNEGQGDNSYEKWEIVEGSGSLEKGDIIDCSGSGGRIRDYKEGLQIRVISVDGDTATVEAVS
jgi:hypothetical protein